MRRGVTTQRHPGDLVRLVLALVLLVVTAVVARGTGARLSASEADCFRLFNDLPRPATPLALIPLAAPGPLPLRGGGAPTAAGSAGAAAALFRRWRLLLDLLVGGALGYGVARLLVQLVDRDGPAGFIAQLPRRSTLDLPALLAYGS